MAFLNTLLSELKFDDPAFEPDQLPQFGQATQTLNNSLGSGGQSSGLNPLYQIGGPRSMQLAMKLQF